MNSKNFPLVTKADGEQEMFDPTKLDGSLARAGATQPLREQIVSRVTKEIRDGMTTSEIYRHAFELLRRSEILPIAARYSIKRAIFDLGPSGYPFERFIAEVLRTQGWRTRVSVELTGKCAPHEVDVLADRDDVRVGIEVKFHNAQGTKTDVKDALYVQARFTDLKATPHEESRVAEGWLVTNTQFTRNAIRYGQCSGLTMLGWSYPHNRGLQTLIEEGGVHPVTALTTLTQPEKRRLLDRNIVLCRNIRNGRHLLEEQGIRHDRIDRVLAEAQSLCALTPVDKPETVSAS